MEIEITTDYLRKCCRICLEHGELNMWEHSIYIKHESDGEEENSEITAVDLFKIYENCYDSVLGLGDQLKFLCFSCLDELTKSFLFYKKAAHANIEIQHLYKEAEKNELQKEEAKIVRETFENSENRFSNTFQDCIEEVVCDPVEEHSTNGTNAEYQNIVTDLFVFDDNIVEGSQKTVADETISTSNKQACMEEGQCDNTSSIPMLPQDAESSLVVTQFVPTRSHIIIESGNQTGMMMRGEDEGGGDGNIKIKSEINTVDYAAVKIKSSNIEKICKVPPQLQINSELSSEVAAIISEGHRDEIQQEEGNSVYFCKYCPQAFTAHYYLIAHIRKSHVCKYCTQSFAKSSDLFVHIRQAHHQHKCAICNKEFSSHSNLRGHIKRIHGIRLPAQVALLDYHPPSSDASGET